MDNQLPFLETHHSMAFPHLLSNLRISQIAFCLSQLTRSIYSSGYFCTIKIYFSFGWRLTSKANRVFRHIRWLNAGSAGKVKHFLKKITLKISFCWEKITQTQPVTLVCVCLHWRFNWAMIFLKAMRSRSTIWWH